MHPQPNNTTRHDTHAHTNKTLTHEHIHVRAYVLPLCVHARPPLTLLCATWEASQAGNVLERQQRHMTACFSMSLQLTVSTTCVAGSGDMQRVSAASVGARGLHMCTG